MSNKYSNALTIVLVMVVVAILGLVGYMAYDTIHQKNINAQSNTAIQEFDKVRRTIKRDNNTVEENETIEDTGISEDVLDRLSKDKEGKSQNQEQTEKTYLNGYEVLGYISIPKTKCEYPILAQVTAKSLETAVAVLYPSNPVLNTVGNVVIVGHNYRNNLFFSNNSKLAKGDRIIITSAEEKVTYEIYNMYYTTANDASYMQRDTEGRREISLSTCNNDSTQRLIIWAREK